MKYITLAHLICVVGLVFLALNAQHKYTNNIQAYKTYYTCTETLLDSVLTETDDILETSCGKAYLDAKFTVDNLKN